MCPLVAVSQACLLLLSYVTNKQASGLCSRSPGGAVRMALPFELSAETAVPALAVTTLLSFATVRAVVYFRMQVGRLHPLTHPLTHSAGCHWLMAFFLFSIPASPSLVERKKSMQMPMGDGVGRSSMHAVCSVD